ncbi:hypothetical protein TWF718_000485 [Orbilia javanica]|uniref:F-box domain-containing protein n=1 Tax=Orbilia javanica TaxID=47235 RepID=A0AAN8P181_9PEZI
MNSEVLCVLCGSFLRTSRYRPTSPLWILHPRIIGHAYEGPATWTTTEYVGTKGTTAAFNVAEPKLEIWDNSLAGMITLDSSYQIGRSREVQCSRELLPCKPCYLMHNECWGLFKIVAGKLGVKESELPLYQNYLYRAFSAAPYDGGNLVWPHGYNLLPEEALMYRIFRFNSSYSYGEPHGLDHVGYSELQVASPRTYMYYGNSPSPHKEILAEQGSINIPDFLPLPLELTHKVLCYLSGADITTLSEIKSIKTLQIPDLVWKSQFNLEAELGFLIQPHYMATAADTTWRAKYLFTKKIITENHREAANLKRRWDIFASLVHRVRDTEDSDEANIYDLDLEDSKQFAYKIVDRDQAFVCQSLPEKSTDSNGSASSDGVKIRGHGELKHIVTTGMCVSYTGAGKLRFVSGFRFLPSGERLGLINAQDEVFVQLSSPTATIQTMWVATSKYGIRSISVAREGVDYEFEKFDDVYVNRKMFKSGSEGIEILKFAITVGVSEVTSLHIDSPDFICGGDLDRQELFLQRYSWSPTIPPVFSSKRRIDIDHNLFRGHLNYITERARFESASLEYVIFTELTVVRFTCWLGSNFEICGVGVFVEGKDSPFLMGKMTELSTDTIIEKGEAIVSLELYTGGKDQLPVGISVHTDRGVAFRFMAPRILRPPDKHILNAGEGKEIVGFFGGFDGSGSGAPLFRLLAIGIITSTRESLSTPSSETETITRQQPSNPQLRIWDEATNGPCPKDLLSNQQPHLGYFVSTAPLANCKYLECYFQDGHYGYRLTGIRLGYGKEAGSPQQGPTVLGRLSRPSTKNVFEIESDWGEYIVAVDVYIKKAKLAPMLADVTLAVVGIAFWTSSQRKITCGKCQAEYATKVLPLRTSIEEDLILKWIYSKDIDYLTNVKET